MISTGLGRMELVSINPTKTWDRRSTRDELSVFCHLLLLLRLCMFKSIQM